MNPDFVTAVLDQFSAGDTVLLQNETSCVEEIIHQAARRGMRTAMNAAPANEKLYYEKIAKGGRRDKRKKIETKQGHSEKEQPCKRVVSVF